MENIENKLKNEIKNQAIENLCEIIKKITIEIERNFITRKEHEKIIKELIEKGEIKK